MIKPILERDNQDGIFIVYGDKKYTREALLELSLQMAESLARKPGSICLMHTDNPAEIIAAIDACIRSDAHLMIAHTTLPQGVFDDLVEKFRPEMIVEAGSLICLPGSVRDTREQSIFIMTSGTTGQPKIAAHHLDRLLASVRVPLHGRSHNWMLTYQPTGFAGLQVSLAAILSGARLFAPDKRTPSSFLSTARDHSVTHVSGTPTFWRSFLISGAQGLEFEQVTLGGEAVDQLILDRLQSAFPRARISHTYASTEAGMVFAVHDGREGFPREWLNQSIDGIELKIVDHHLHIRSHRKMRKYENLDHQPFEDQEWLVTRDLCEIKGDRVCIIGREDSVINVAGSKVYPAEIEAFLLQQPGVAEARVFAVQNPISGALVGAEVVADSTSQDDDLRIRLIAACREGLAGFKIPRMLRIVDHISINPSLKKGF
jgi:acyl-coenzyme A synthetase/AMP-(fatty) acid ligase